MKYYRQLMSKFYALKWKKATAPWNGKVTFPKKESNVIYNVLVRRLQGSIFIEEVRRTNRVGMTSYNYPNILSS